MKKLIFLPFKLAVLLVVSILLITSCSGNVKENDNNNEDIQTTTSTTEVVYPDEYKIPDNPSDINIEYVERVVQKFEDVKVPVLHSFYKQNKLDDQDKKIIDAIATDEMFQNYVIGYSYNSNPLSEDIEDTVGPVVVKVKNLIKLTDGCVMYTAEYDYGNIFKSEIEKEFNTYVLVLEDHDRSVNPTPWVDGTLDDDRCFS